MPWRIGFPRSLPRRVAVGFLRAMEALALKAAGRRWKIDRFNRLIEGDVCECARVLRAAGAKIIVGIAFHKEASNIGTLVGKLQQDLEASGGRAAIVIVGERKTREVLFATPLPAPTPSVTVTRLAKPFGFGQKPGLSRRSWSHWVILQIARQCGAGVVFIDADVRNSDGWVQLYLGAMQNRGAHVVVADYVRQFGRDDAMVHIWDRLLFGALFKKWVAFRHGGDYAISREFVQTIASDHSVMRERSYTLDSAVIARAASAGGRIESVWLSTKEHEPISTRNLFNRLPDLVRSVFEDVATHLPRLLRVRHAEAAPTRLDAAAQGLAMRDLIGADFRRELHADMTARFQLTAGDVRRAAGSVQFSVVAAQMKHGFPEQIALPARVWARLTVGFLMRFIRNPEGAVRNKLVNAYVPVLQLGVLGFLNETFDLRYEEALLHLEDKYLPQFQQIWNCLSRRLPVYRWAALRRWI
jgi:hypothetical protein